MNISGLTVVNAFVQANMPDAVALLDRRGALIAKWRSEFQTNAVATDLVSFQNSSGPFREVNVNLSRIWTHFQEPDTLDFVVDHAIRLVDGISAQLDVTTYQRVGFRLETVWPIPNLEELVPEFSQNIFAQSFTGALRQMGARQSIGFDAVVGLVLPEFTARLSIRPVIRKPEEKTNLPLHAVMFDIDLYVEGELSARDSHRFLHLARDWYMESLPTIPRAVLTGGSA